MSTTRSNPVKVVIQCSAKKNEECGSFVSNAHRVKFVAHPECYRQCTADVLFRPDDPMPPTSTSWRQHLLTYNRERRADNPDHLLKAVDLYSHPIYHRLLCAVGHKNLFILSAGWGLIKSDFLLPDYDITFSAKAEAWQLRKKHDCFSDFAQLTQSELVCDETLYFVGGKDYLPLYYTLTEPLVARKVVYYASDKICRHADYQYIRSRSSGTNWQYRCADDFLQGQIEK